MSIVESGKCRGVGEESKGMLRPRGPSGDDCRESVAGLAVDEVPLGVAAEARFKVNGKDVLMCCLHMGCGDEVGDGQHPLPSVILGDEVLVEGCMLYHLGRGLSGSFLVEGPSIFVMFRIVSEEKGGRIEGDLIAR